MSDSFSANEFPRCFSSSIDSAKIYSIYFHCRELKLSANRLAHFPVEVNSLPNLELLDLSLNKVS
jgi:hypothetical protein